MTFSIFLGHDTAIALTPQSVSLVQIIEIEHVQSQNINFHTHIEKFFEGRLQKMKPVDQI